MSYEDPFAYHAQYSCFNCGEVDQPVDWYLGLDPSDPCAQAHYACHCCAPLLVDCHLIAVDGIEEGDYVQLIGDNHVRCVHIVNENRSLQLDGMPGCEINPSAVTKKG